MPGAGWLGLVQVGLALGCCRTCCPVLKATNSKRQEQVRSTSKPFLGLPGALVLLAHQKDRERAIHMYGRTCIKKLAVPGADLK